MCRLVAITSNECLSPIENILALETMKEGHDSSGLGLTLKDLGGEFEKLKRQERSDIAQCALRVREKNLKRSDLITNKNAGTF